jgi:hypothetical protein
LALVTHRRLHVVPALVLVALVALVVQAGLSSPAHAAGQRYAAPAGSGTSCTSAAPCSLVTAINSASSSTEVIIAAGTYELGGTGLANGQSAVNVHGAAGGARPVINTAAGTGLQLTGTGAKLTDVRINHIGASFGLNVFAASVTVQRVDVRSTAPVACFLGYSGLARDSLCTTSAAGGIAVDDSWGSDTSVTSGLMTLRNITAVATGTSSYGVRAEAGNFANIDVSARNVIASGTAADLRVSRTATSSDSDFLNVTSSNYDTTSTNSSGATITPAGTGTNQKTAPVFADADYHQAPTSPTIDRGTLDSSVGTADLDAQPRPTGVAPDIGVDEFVPDTTPPDLAFDRTPRARTHRHKAVFRFHANETASETCVVDKRPPVPCGTPFTVRFKKSGRHRVTVIATDTAGNIDPTPATYTWQIKKKKHKRHHHRQHHQH